MLTEQETRQVAGAYLLQHPHCTLGWLTLPEAEQVAAEVRYQVETHGGWDEARQHWIDYGAPIGIIRTAYDRVQANVRPVAKSQREPMDFAKTIRNLVDEVAEELGR